LELHFVLKLPIRVVRSELKRVIFSGIAVGVRKGPKKFLGVAEVLVGDLIKSDISIRKVGEHTV
jgi:hypothetical protein